MYTQGYVRRQPSDLPLDSMRGQQFLELNEAAGPGSSGEPVIWHPMESWANSDGGLNFSLMVIRRHLGGGQEALDPGGNASVVQR